jgi:8-oxo-dGTP pyrophosphatase MutT (NUDIX family)
MDFAGAGVLFTNQRVALAGYHQYKTCLSGIGGKREASDRTPHETAFREALEELFSIAVVPHSIIKQVCEVFSTPDPMLISSSYIAYVYSFNDLTRLLHLCKSLGMVSPVYPSFPETIEDLLFQRIKGEGEISHLAIVPVVKVAPVLESFFQRDLEKIRIE